MFKFYLFCLSFLLVGFNTSGLHAYDSLPSNYYPYNKRIVDVYIGLNLATTSDVSTHNSAGNPDWQALYNPVHLLGSSGVSANIGIRPLELVPFLRNFRFEAEWQYRNSNYKILQDSEKNGWLPKTKIPSSGAIYMKNGFLFNVYYDFRFFSNNVYPYIAFGGGAGELGIRNLDFEILQNGIGAEYHGYKAGVPITQFIIGMQYDTKIIKTSFYVEYRYERTGSIIANPKYLGNEVKEGETPPTGVDVQQPRNIAFKMHTLLAGIKYYLY